MDHKAPPIRHPATSRIRSRRRRRGGTQRRPSPLRHAPAEGSRERHRGSRGHRCLRLEWSRSNFAQSRARRVAPLRRGRGSVRRGIRKSVTRARHVNGSMPARSRRSTRPSTSGRSATGMWSPGGNSSSARWRGRKGFGSSLAGPTRRPAGERTCIPSAIRRTCSPPCATTPSGSRRTSWLRSLAVAPSNDRAARLAASRRTQTRSQEVSVSARRTQRQACTSSGASSHT